MIAITSFTLAKPPNGLRSRSMALGWAWILFGSRKNLKPEKCLKMRQNPQRPVHALLARFFLESDAFH